MPGLNLSICLNRKEISDINPSKQLIDRLIYDKSYKSQTLFSANGINLLFNGYAEYPRYVFEQGQIKLFIDGALYGITEEQFSKNALVALQEIVDSNGSKVTALQNLVIGTDGEFTVYYFDSGRGVVIIFNDALGRIPYYWRADKDRFLLGRSLKYITGLSPKVEIDVNGLMEYFLFSAPLGERTFFKDISRLLPATMFIIDLHSGRLVRKILHSYNLDERHEDKPLQYYVQSMYELFLEGLKNRVARFPQSKSIVAMSGGLDSRAVLTGLLKLGVDVQGITFRDHYNALRRDWPVVEKLVKTLDVKHKFYDVPPNNLELLEKLIIGKDGMGVMGLMGSVLYWMEMIEADFGKNIVYYTGDEGNYIAAPRFGQATIKSTPQLIHEIISHNSLSVFSLEKTAAIFRRSAEDVMDYLCAYFDSYAEKNPIHKIDRFFIFERSFKFTMENQDRIRLYFWPMAPHYGINYARFAFKIDNRYLAGWKVYAGMLKLLNPEAAKIRYANFGIPLDSPLMPLYLPLRSLATSNETIRRNLIGFLRLLKNPAGVNKKFDELKANDDLRKYYRRVLEINPEFSDLSDVIDMSYLTKLVQNDNYIYRLYLITNIVKYLSTVENRVRPDKLKIAV